MTDRIGRQDPTISYVLPYEKTDGQIAVDLYELTGRTAMPWQRAMAFDILAVNDSGKWVHTKSGYAVPRRNGKGEILVMIELYALAAGLRLRNRQTAYRHCDSERSAARITVKTHR